MIRIHKEGLSQSSSVEVTYLVSCTLEAVWCSWPNGKHLKAFGTGNDEIEA